MLLHSQEDADRAAERRGFTAVHRSGRPASDTTGPSRSNAHKRQAQKLKAERLFGILWQAGIRTEADFALVTEEMLATACEIAGKGMPGTTVRIMLRNLYKGKG